MMKVCFGDDVKDMRFKGLKNIHVSTMNYEVSSLIVVFFLKKLEGETKKIGASRIAKDLLFPK